MKIIIGSVLFLITSCVQASDPITPNKIRLDIKKYGLTETILKLDDSRKGKSDYEKVLEKISTGDNEWLSLARELAPGTDASTLAGLVTYLAYALPKNPEGVLLATGAEEYLLIADICSCPFYEGDPIDIPSYKRESISALKKLKAPKVELQRIKCLATLQK